jgi:hypothetical protein
MYIPGTTSNINYRKINFLIHIYSGSLQFVLLYVGSPKVKEVLLSNILRQGQNIFGKDWTVLFFILLIFVKKFETHQFSVTESRDKWL